MCVRIHKNYHLFFSDFNESWIFSKDFRKIFKYQIPWNSVRWELRRCMRIEVWTDGEEDMTNPLVAVGNFANAPKTENLSGSLQSSLAIVCIFLQILCLWSKIQQYVAQTALPSQFQVQLLIFQVLNNHRIWSTALHNLTNCHGGTRNLRLQTAVRESLDIHKQGCCAVSAKCVLFEMLRAVISHTSTISMFAHVWSVCEGTGVRVLRHEGIWVSGNVRQRTIKLRNE